MKNASKAIMHLRAGGIPSGKSAGSAGSEREDFEGRYPAKGRMAKNFNTEDNRAYVSLTGLLRSQRNLIAFDSFGTCYWFGQSGK
jgi:hypothetical protein